MVKRILISLLCFFCVFSLYAGDVAEYLDIGISSDGKTYLFAQFGRTDKVYQSYAEIYAVDIAKNIYVPGDVFKTPPTQATSAKTGRDVYNDLFEKNKTKILKYKSEPAGIDNTLYIRSDESKSPTALISFKDFERSTSEKGISFEVRLVPTFQGSGINVKSSFVISIDKRDTKGNLISSTQAGTPDIKREGVVRYCIDRIICDDEGKNLIFIVEKQIAGSDGISIRYMVETIHID